MMNFFRKLMYGRYGVDQLSIAIIILSFAISIISSIADFYPLSLLSFILIIVAYVRIFSKNISKRYGENIKFLKLWNPIKAKAQVRINRMKYMKTHKYFSCPNCKQSLRVPRGQGKITVTCPKCKTEFSKKS